jgi:hypothetical protein
LVGWRPDVAPAHPARPQLGPFHQACVQLHDAVKVEASADPGVEERLVFHQPDGGQDSGQRSAADLGPTGVARSPDGRLPQGVLPLGDRPGSAVNDERRPGRGYCAWA